MTKTAKTAKKAAVKVPEDAGLKRPKAVKANYRADDPHPECRYTYWATVWSANATVKALLSDVTDEDKALWSTAVIFRSKGRSRTAEYVGAAEIGFAEQLVSDLNTAERRRASDAARGVRRRTGKAVK